MQKNSKEEQARQHVSMVSVRSRMLAILLALVNWYICWMKMRERRAMWV
jgi:hypothetical protein